MTGLYEDAEPVRIRGWAAIYGREYEPDARGRRLLVRPGAIDPGGRVDLCVAHDEERPLANTRDGSLRLWSTPTGLQFEARVAPSWSGLSLARAVSSGTLRAASACYPGGRTSRLVAGVEHVERTRLCEISLCAARRCPGAVAWLDVEDDFPPEVARARAVWSVERQGHRLGADRAEAGARGRPRAVILRELDRVLARHRPDLLRDVRP